MSRDSRLQYIGISCVKEQCSNIEFMQLLMHDHKCVWPMTTCA